MFYQLSIQNLFYNYLIDLDRRLINLKSLKLKERKKLFGVKILKRSIYGMKVAEHKNQMKEQWDQQLGDNNSTLDRDAKEQEDIEN